MLISVVLFENTIWVEKIFELLIILWKLFKIATQQKKMNFLLPWILNIKPT